MSVVYADISRHNGDVIWGRFTLPGVLVKLGGSDDGTYIDAKYVEETTAARTFGKHLGHYWFNGVGSPAADARFFLANLSQYQDEDLLILDVEDMVGTTGTAWTPAKALSWFKTVKAAKPNARLVVYMNQSVENGANWSALVNLGVELWLAHYGANDGTVAGSGTYTLKNWKAPLLVQYTSRGTTAGVAGDVDLSIATVDLFPAAVPEADVASTIGSYIYTPKVPLLLSTTGWTTVHVNAIGGVSYLWHFDGVVHTDFQFKIANLPFGSTVQARIQIVTYDSTDTKVTGTAYSDVVELQGSSGYAFPSFGDTVVVNSNQRLRLVMAAQSPGVQVIRSAASVLAFKKA